MTKKIIGDLGIKAGRAVLTASGEVSASAEAFIEERAQAGPGAPDVLYHYTSAQGLIDILCSWEIWATCITHLNDASEYVHTLRLADELPTNVLLNEHWKLDRYLVDGVKASGTGYGSPVYVASFSGDGNVLSQWRAYCPPGNGYSIGFARDRLQRCAHETSDGLLGFPEYEHYDRWQLVKCEYDREKQVDVLRRLLNETHEAVQMLEESERTVLQRFVETHWSDFELADIAGHPSSVATIQGVYARGVERVAPTFKDDAFREEQEWRIVSPRIADRKPKFRAGRFSVIPYVSFRLPMIEDKRHVDKIIIGPTENTELAYNTVALMCDTLGVSVGSIENSRVPFRHWDSKQS